MVEDGDAGRYIQTIPRRGYRFVGTVHNTDQPDELMIEEHARSRIVVEQIDRADSEIAVPLSETERLITDAVPRWWSKRIALAAIGLVLVVVIAVLVWNAAHKPGLPLSPEPITAIAVLPITNSSNNPDAEYLADGITESIISNLSQIGQLKVMARSTVFRFKGAGADPQSHGREGATTDCSKIES